MSQDRQIMLLLTEVHERVVRIETKMEILPALQLEVKQHGDEILKAKTSLRIIRWVSSILLVSIPASAMAVFRILRP